MLKEEKYSLLLSTGSTPKFHSNIQIKYSIIYNFRETLGVGDLICKRFLFIKFR